jgi:hypothetical protein
MRWKRELFPTLTNLTSTIVRQLAPSGKTSLCLLALLRRHAGPTFRTTGQAQLAFSRQRIPAFRKAVQNLLLLCVQ